MAVVVNKVESPELEQFLINDVKLTGNILGSTSSPYGSVEEVDMPGARVVGRKLNSHHIDMSSPQQVQEWVSKFVEDCKLMSQLRHPNIVQFLGVCYFTGSPLPGLLTEKYLTSLDSLLETYPDISISVKVHLLTGTSQGLVYLHSHNPPIVHHNLSAQNVLIDSGCNAKITDVGLSRMIAGHSGQLAQAQEATEYRTATDIFSFGVISLFTITQVNPKDLNPTTSNPQDPSKNYETERQEQYIESMKQALGETHPLIKLTSNCLKDTEDQPSAVELLRQLKEVGKNLPNCFKAKLELLCRISETQEQAQQHSGVGKKTFPKKVVADKEKQEANPAKNEGPKESDGADKRYTRNELLQLARIADNTERYEDMAKWMREMVKTVGIEGSESRDLLNSAYKNISGQRRTSWRVVTSMFQRSRDETEKALLAVSMEEIYKEQADICNEVIGLLDHYLIPKATDDGSKVFYLKMKGDYFRFLAELDLLKKDKNVIDNAEKAYTEGLSVAENLSAVNPIRLGLALNFSVFYYETINDSSRASQLAKKTFDDGIAKMDELREEDYSKSTLILQLLRDNLTLWSADDY